MAQHPLEVLKQVVTPQVVDSADPAFSNKSALLDEFYPILLSIFAKEPERVQQVVQNSGENVDNISTLLGSSKNGLNSLVEDLSRYHNVPVPAVQSVLQAAIPLSARAIEHEAPNGHVAGYLGSYSQSIAERVPAWAVPLIGTLGLGSIAAHAGHHDHVLVREPPQEPAFFRKLLPWIALLILVLLLLLWRSCRHQAEPVITTAPIPVQPVTTTQATAIPASLAITSGSGNQLLACRTQVGTANLGQDIVAAVRQTFPAQRLCNASVDQAYSNSLPGQQSLLDILALIKATPNASLQWTGDQIIVNAPNASDVTRLVGQIKALAPDINVSGAAPLDVNQSVNTSIDAARTALSGLQANARPEDVARALNLQIINFATDSAVIPEQNRAILDQAAALIQQVPNVSLQVEGYTDSTGNAGHNKTLSEQRAKSVVDYLVGKGVSSDKLQPVGYGAENPVADNVTEQGKFRNRRIEFTVTNTQTGNAQTVNENTAQTSTAEQAPSAGESPTVIASGSGSAPVVNP